MKQSQRKHLGDNSTLAVVLQPQKDKSFCQEKAAHFS